MADRLSKPLLIARFVESVEASGWSAIALTSDQHPAQFSLIQGEQKVSILLYIWNLTHGGYPRNPNELRIQVTGIDRFEEKSGPKTLALGWSEEEKAFAGFDVTKHRIAMTGRSPSFQIRREVLQKAKVHAFSTQLRGNSEIAIAFRPDFALAYIQELEAMHGAAVQSSDLEVLQKISDKPVDAEIEDIPPGPRKTVLEQVQRKVRDAKFRNNILKVYDYRCAISGIQLDLLDAAHIIPVEHIKGTDETKNGMCLSAIHHRAFDQGLIGIKSDYTVVCNDRRFSHLKKVGWSGGEDLFRATLRDSIALPAKKQFYPDSEYLIFGQELRGWSRRQLV